MSEETVNKTELLENMDAGWDDLLAFVASLTPEQQSIPTDAAGWTVKDHLIHLAIWQDGVLAMLEGENRIAAMGVPQEVWNTRDFDQINAVIQQAHKDKDASTVMQELHTSKARFFAKVTTLSEEDFQRPNPDSPVGTRMIEYIMGDSYDHYHEHLPWMQAIVDGSK